MNPERIDRAPLQCVVHWAPTVAVSSGDLELLSDNELRRMARLRQEADRCRYVSATALLRRVLASETGRDPSDIVVDRRCTSCGRDHGRPRAPQSGLSISLAHAGTVVGVAMTRCAPIGLDVEPVDGRNLMPLVDQVLCRGETARSTHDLLRYWTRKESLVKATGDGIGVGMNLVRVSAPADPPRALAYPGRPGLRAQLVDLQCRPGYMASLAVLTTSQVRIVERWHPSR